MRVLKNHDSVTIVMEDDAHFLDGFMDIFVDDGDTPSPFKDVESARLFAEMIVKLLEAVHDFKLLEGEK